MGKPSQPATDPCTLSSSISATSLSPRLGCSRRWACSAALLLSFHTAPLAGCNREALWDAGLFTVLSALILSRLLLVIDNLKVLSQLPAADPRAPLADCHRASPYPHRVPFIYLKNPQATRCSAPSMHGRHARRSHGRFSRSAIWPKAAIPAFRPRYPGASCRPLAEPACIP